MLHNGQLVHDSATILNILGRNIAAISSITNIDDHFKAIKSREEAIPLNLKLWKIYIITRNYRGGI